MIKESLEDIGNESMIENIDLEILEELVNVLNPIKITVEAISRKNTNLRTANLAVDFMFKKLRDLDCTLGNEIWLQLKTRINSRKNVDIEERLCYLTTGNMPSNKILNFSTNLLIRLFNDDVEVVNDEQQESNIELNSNTVTQISIEQEFNHILETAINICRIPVLTDDKFGHIKKEFFVI